jgi:long-chain-fatty-acid--[acyl-carrier-protein] ligase
MTIFKHIKEAGLRIAILLVRILFSLRYRIKVKGLDKICAKKGALILPNHPAEIDPVIIIMVLWKKLRPHPLVVEHFFYLKGFRFVMEWVGALPFPNMEVAANKWKVRQLEKQFIRIVEALKKGENFLIYPAGKLKRTDLEVLGGSSFVPNLLHAAPQTELILVRTSGLWGSRFSRVVTGKTPDFSGTLWEGIKIILKNGIFFTPRREVVLEIEEAPSNFPKRGTRLEINRFLEAWYNEKGPEPVTFVSDYFWKYQIPRRAVRSKAEEGAFIVPPEREKEVIEEIAALSKHSSDKIQRELDLATDLGLDSLDIAQIYAFLDEKYDIANLPQGQLQTVEDVLRAASGVEQEVEVEKKREEKWPQEASRPEPSLPWGNTLMEAFLHSCQRMGNLTACADSMSGILSYKRLKQAALILSKKIKEMPGDHIGILLPASVAANLLIFATLLAKKTPVMLNWTVGVRALNHAVEIAQLQTVVSSRRFLNRLDNGDLGNVDDLLCFLEDLRDKITLRDKLSGLFLSWKSCSALLMRLGLDQIKSEAPAVIIFTSGTESLPKGVPLSHQNILSNQRAALQCVSFTARDTLFGVLPPFHSFGFTVTGILPLLAGLRVCYSPDPTDSHGIAHEIEHWKPTLFCCAPGFIKALLRVAKEEQLSSLNLIVTGAEKAPPELLEGIRALGPNKIVLEGYGITECSPIVTLERPGTPHKGVGQPLPGVQLLVIDRVTGTPLPQGEEGEVCISGPTVFSGYLGGKPDPFIEYEGKKWYRSGDCGFLDADGTLILSGRLKRFVKVGGEMLSLGGMEEELIRLAREKKWVALDQEGPYLAVSAKEKESDRPQVILYTTFEVDRDQVNAALKESGHGRIAKIATVQRVQEIPLTGTGKIHHRLLDETYG